MAINPLDLQVNFTQMNQVGKQQSLLKESEVLRQDQASEQLQKNADKNAKDVPETKDLSTGPDKIKDQEKKKNSSNRENEENNNEEKEEKDEIENSNSNNESIDLKDPNLGQNIDIIG